jgi:hypothetical protein
MIVAVFALAWVDEGATTVVGLSIVAESRGVEEARDSDEVRPLS